MGADAGASAGSGASASSAASAASANERLETGWWPDTAAGDTVLRSAVYAMAGSAEELAAAAAGAVSRANSITVAWAGSPCAYLNCVVPLAPPEHWDELSQPGQGALGQGALGQGGLPVTLWSAWPTPDLRARGWQLVGHPPLMYRQPGPPPLHLQTPAELTVDEVTDPQRLAEVSHTMVLGYPVEELMGEPAFFPDDLLDSDGWRFWLGTVAGSPVAAAAGYVTDDVVLVSWVATLPAVRRRGYGEALTWRAALAAPGRPAVLLASDAGRGVYERMGFAALLRFTLWTYPGAPAAR